MQDSLLQKLLVEASGGKCDWLPQVCQATGANPVQRRRAETALELFRQFAPQVEQEAFAQADARLRDYEGTPFAQEHRGTLEAAFVAAGYSKLALVLAALF